MYFEILTESRLFWVERRKKRAEATNSGGAVKEGGVGLEYGKEATKGDEERRRRGGEGRGEGLG